MADSLRYVIHDDAPAGGLTRARQMDLTAFGSGSGSSAAAGVLPAVMLTATISEGSSESGGSAGSPGSAGSSSVDSTSSLLPGVGGAVVMISAAGKFEPEHQGHYLCQACTEDTMAVLLRKALEKRSRRVRSKEMQAAGQSATVQHAPGLPLGAKPQGLRRIETPATSFVATC